VNLGALGRASPVSATARGLRMRDDPSMETLVRTLADTLVLGAALDEVRRARGGFELLDHWKQGEFHHDVVVRLPAERGLGAYAGRAAREDAGPVLVIATNCNGGVKEVLAFERAPDRWALWHWRCPHVADFTGELPALLARATTEHWFDPCELLAPDARSELREEHRERQRGGGWVPRGCGVGKGGRT
jgi:hypothetical protein